MLSSYKILNIQSCFAEDTVDIYGGAWAQSK